jgi:uncharacterized protein YhfF
VPVDLWQAYLAAHPEHRDENPPVEGFGDSPEMADELLALVVDGIKRATAGLLAAYEHDGDAVPAVGDHWVVTDGRGEPQVVLQTREVRTGRLDSVDAKFARDEGEGDLSLASWLDDHRRYFAREVERCSLPTPDGLDALDVVFERFAVVWPPEIAD